MTEYEIFVNYATFAVVWIFVASLIYMYIRDLRRTANFGQLTTVYMKLVTQECAVTVKLCTLTGEMHDYKATAESYVKNIRCEGYLFPRLTFDWQTLLITNKLTGQITKLKQSYPIPLGLAWAIRTKILPKRSIQQLMLYCERFSALNVEVVVIGEGAKAAVAALAKPGGSTSGRSKRYVHTIDGHDS